MSMFQWVLRIVLALFVFSISGWILETINESITRKKFVNKGFFRGPWTLSHGIGGLAVWAIGSPFKEHPIAVFVVGVVVCTAVEYIMAVFLEKCFHVKCWDYRTYPHTRFCTYKGRICLTISTFFGLITLFVVYIYGTICMTLADRLGRYLLLVDIVLVVLFTTDVVSRCIYILRCKKNGVKVEGFAVFSMNNDNKEAS